MGKFSGASRTMRLTVLPNGEGLPLPTYETSGSAGMDLRAGIAEGDTLTLESGARTLVPTGLQIALPTGVEGQVRPRSGLALKHGITVLNAPGTIDSDYRGEVKVLLINHGDEAFSINRGDRIAQLVIATHEQLVPVRVAALDKTARGAGGYGSTGTA